jgi:hypothetical protein
MVRRYAVVNLLALSVVLQGCELTEVTIAQGEPVVVVHSVLEVGAATQFVILEKSLYGGGPTNRFFSGLVPPWPAGNDPVADATVTLTHRNPGACATPTVVLDERPAVHFTDGTTAPSGTYTTTRLCRLRPGDQVDLRVETPAGEVVTGTTIIPGARAIDVRTRREVGNVELHRATDSIWVDVDPISARALVLELARDVNRTPYLPGGPFVSGDLFTLATDTMGALVAGDALSFEDDEEGEAVFIGGRYYTLAVAVADTNYFDFVRSFSDPFTGRGFINHLDGGIGVFGSVMTSVHEIRVTDDQEDPREGRYRVTGTVNGTPVDAVLDVYLDPLRGSQTSAFVDGTWEDGAIATSGDGSYFLNSSLSGSQSGQFDMQFATVGQDTVVYRLEGFPARPSNPFDVTAYTMAGFEQPALDTLTVERLPVQGAPMRRLGAQ